MSFSKSAILTAFLLFVTNCGHSNQPSETHQTRHVIFFDSTGTYPSYVPPALARLTVINDSMKMDTIQGSSRINYWFAAMAASESDSIWKIIDQNSLIGSADPVLPDSQIPSMGFGSTMIVFIKDNLLDTIVISKQVKNQMWWSSGLRMLVAYKDSLVKKYQR
jgi:hypothetical protein